MEEKNILAHLRIARALAKDEISAGNGSRELSLVVTKIDEAILWQCEDQRLKRPVVNEKSR